MFYLTPGPSTPVYKRPELPLHTYLNKGLFWNNGWFSFWQPCANGGHCVLNNITSYSCVCAPGWTGPTCLVNINECVRHRCQNGATCVDEVGGYRWVWVIFVFSYFLTQGLFRVKQMLCLSGFKYSSDLFYTKIIINILNAF